MFHRTQLLLDKADTFRKAGQWSSAIAVCESLFESNLQSGRNEDALEALLRLGLFYASKTSNEIATEYYELVLEMANGMGLPSKVGRALNGLGILRQRAGDLSGAEELYHLALEQARQSGDRQARGDAEVNLGIIAGVRGDDDEAMERYQRALAEYEEAGDQKRAAQVLNNLGILFTDLRDFDKAKEALDRSLALSRLRGDVQIEGIVLANRTELFLAQGALEAARSSCDEAFEIAGKLENEHLKADALKSYGVIYRESSRFHLAESHFQQAVDLARKISNPLLEADTMREFALLFRQSERNQESLAALNVAHQLYADLQAKRHQAEIDERFEQLEADFLRLVEAWGESIEAKDEYTRGHCQRVADYACTLAARAGIPERDMTWFRMGAFLHDVGKTEVPEEILNKPGRLTDEERFVIEQHTVVGDEMLADTEFPYPIRPMIRSHHERWDGNGYPDRLSGEAIPFTARILHVADVFDALTSARSYRKALETEVALEIMWNDVGSFEPSLLELFTDAIRAPRCEASVSVE